MNKIMYNGAQILLKSLMQEGVSEIFGYPGGVVLPLYDALYMQEDIKHYLVRHEQAAVHAAEGYARVSGKVGVAVVTSGPGACNTITGLANAYYDGTPLILITVSPLPAEPLPPTTKLSTVVSSPPLTLIIPFSVAKMPASCAFK